MDATARSRRYESRGRSLIAGTTPGVQRDRYRSLLCLLEFEAAGGILGVGRLGAAFYAFALILLPALAFVGVVTFQRLVQSSIEDIAYAQRVARLRAFYLDVAPGLEEFLLVVRGPPAEAPLHHESRRPRS